MLNGYSGDELVYNKTLGDWRTHNGIDYACAKDAAVQSPTAGTVVLAGSDGSWGPTVAIKDSAGRVWLVLVIVRTVRCNKRKKAKFAAANAAK